MILRSFPEARKFKKFIINIINNYIIDNHYNNHIVVFAKNFNKNSPNKENKIIMPPNISWDYQTFQVNPKKTSPALVIFF